MFPRQIRLITSLVLLGITLYLLVLDVFHIWVFLTDYLPPDLVDASQWHQTDFWFWNLTSIPFEFVLALMTGFAAYKVKPPPQRKDV